MANWMLAVALGALLGVGLRAWRRARHRRRVAERRIVELPNSHYSSKGVLNQIDRDRWQGIHLPSLHPLNRGEVERLLDLIDSEGVSALSPKDRVFLDNMTRLRLG